MRPKAIAWAAAALLGFAAAQAHAQQSTVTLINEPVFGGFTWTVSGVAALDAIQVLAEAAPGVTRAEANVNQQALENVVHEQYIGRRTLIQDAGHGNRGILLINQEAGNLNNQANAVVVALTVGAGSLLQYLDLWGGGAHLRNTVSTRGGAREDRIENSFNEAGGIVAVNQSAGNLNSMANLVGVVFGQGYGPQVLALGDATLGAITADNTLLQEEPGPRTDIVTDSFRGFRGLAAVSLSAGDLNVIRNAVGVGVAVVEVR